MLFILSLYIFSNTFIATLQLLYIVFADMKIALPLKIESTSTQLVSEHFTVIQTSYGRIIEDMGGFRYSLSNKQKRGTESWRCSRKAHGCKAYVVTLNNLIIQKKYVHTHEPPQFD